MTGPDSLNLILFSGGFDRVHYGLVLASAAVAVNRRATLFFTGRAVIGLTRPDGAGRPGWHGLDPADDGSSPADRDAGFASRGIATYEELLAACVELGATFQVCEMGLRALGLDAAALRPDVPVVSGGAVTFLNGAAPTGGMLFL